MPESIADAATGLTLCVTNWVKVAGVALELKPGDASPGGASPVGRHPNAWVASGPLGGRTGGTVGGRARRLALRQLPASIPRAFGPTVPPPRSGPRPEPLLLPAQSAASPPPSGYGSVGTWRIGATPEPRPGRTRRPSGPQRAVPAPGTRDAARRPHDQAPSRRGHDLPAGGRPLGGGALGGRPTARRWTGRTQGGVPRGLGYPARFGPDPRAFQPTAADRATNATWRLAPRNVCDIRSWGWQTCAELGMAVSSPAAGTSGPW